LQPATKKANRIEYDFVAPATGVQWLYILFNDDVVLRYRLNIKKDLALTQRPFQRP
jgi:hypothetical protein